jgi:hypothetical protein
MLRRIYLPALMWCLLGETACPLAAQPTTEAVAVTLLDGLDNPCGLAVPPGMLPEGPFEVFLSESGAGRVLRVDTANPAVPQEVIVGFPRSELSLAPKLRVGPLGLAFITRSKLAVGGGGLPMGQDVVGVYSLADDRLPLAYEDSDHVVGPIGPSKRSPHGEGDFFSLTKSRTPEAVLVAALDPAGEGWILKASIDANRLAGLQPFIQPGRAAGARMPIGLTMNPAPGFGYLVAAHLGTLGPAVEDSKAADTRADSATEGVSATADDPDASRGAESGQRDSRLVFYSPVSGRVALNLTLDLYDAIALAYSPSGSLYAADLAWSAPEQGGVFRIEQTLDDEGQQACRAVRVATLTHPTSLLFTPDGALYVTTMGVPRGAEDEPAPKGQLLRLLGSF